MFVAHPFGSRTRSRLVARPLRLESLESRHALSALTLIDADACVESSLGGTAQSPIELTPSANDEPLIGPLEIDDYYSFLDGAATANSTAEGEGPILPIVNTPPLVIYFFGWTSESLLELRGTVADDKSPSQCRVEFGGPLAGHWANVLPDGSFSLQTSAMPHSDLITARAVDAEGLYSPWVKIMFLP